MSDTSKIHELEYGDIKIANDVVAVIANIATKEIDGVVELRSGILQSFGKKNTRGVKVNTEDKTVELDLSIIVKYGVRIPDVSEKIQKIVKENVEVMTELTVNAVNIHVIGVDVAQQPSGTVNE